MGEKKEVMLDATEEEEEEEEEETEEIVSMDDAVEDLRGLGIAGSAFMAPRSSVALVLGGGRGATGTD